MVKEVDQDGNGEIDFDEFTQLMVRKMKESETEEELVEVFNEFDKDEDDKVGFKDLKKVFAELGEKISDDDIREMIEEHDTDNSGSLNFE